MDFHGITMYGPLNTDNIRAQDGTLVATISDSTGDISFSADVGVGTDLDVGRDATIFRNFEVQGPLASFLQDMEVGGDIDVTGGVTVGTTMETAALKVTTSPGANKVLVSDASGNATWQQNTLLGLVSVPKDQQILFYTNDTVLGYTIQTTPNDDVVYITKGSVAGGEAGGAAKSGSTWTQPNHTHGLGSITVPPHNHQWYDYQASAKAYSWLADGVSQHLWSSTRISTLLGPQVYITNANGQSIDTTDMYTKLSGSVTGDAGDTEGGATVNTWRPKGRNFTLQKRN